MIETCTVENWTGLAYTEECDLTLQRGETCESIGFVAGALSCGFCAYDYSVCKSCVPQGTVLACESSKLASTRAESLALAATSQEIAVAWTELRDSPTSFEAYVARFTPELTRISVAGPLGKSAIEKEVAVVPLSSGWLLVTPAPTGLFVYRTDAAGSPVKTLEIEGSLEDLTLGPDGTPLLVWREHTDTLRAASITPDGALLAPAQALIVGTEARSFEASYVGGGFLLVGTDHTLGVTVGRIAASGAFEDTFVQPLGPNTVLRSLASVEGGAVVFYFDLRAPTTSLLWAKLDSKGTLIAGPQAVGNYLAPAGRSDLLASGDGLLAALITPPDDPSTQSPQSLVVFPLSATGEASAPTVVAKHRRGFLAGRIARSGSDVVAAWAPGDGDIGLARLDL